MVKFGENTNKNYYSYINANYLKNKGKLMKRKTDGKGISLIVLVITIIIIIILAGAVMLSLNNSNIISKAKLARNLQDFKQLHEQIDMENNSMLLGGTFNPENVQLGSYSSKMRITSNGMIELNESGDSLRADTTFQETLEGLIIPKGANVPSLTTGMTPIMFDVTGLPVEANQTTNISKALLRSTSDVNTDDYWYDYKASVNASGTDNNLSKWANVMLQDRTGDNTMDGSQFVWIPRYAYKITYYTAGDYTTPSTNNVKTGYGTIAVVFLAGTSNYKANDDGTIGDKVGEGSLAQYIVHPAFTNNVEAGGWDKELTGIWVAKYEAGLNSASAVSTVNNKKYPVFKPLQYSYNNILLGDIYSLSRALTAADNPYGLTTKADSHLMKNSEWGAAAYLAYSQYGRNGTEVRINNYDLNGTGGYYGVTGIGATNVNEGPKIPTDKTLAAVPIDNRYNGQYGKLASTTGNVYGIYDMSGGNWERVAGYIENVAGTSNRKTYGASLLTEPGSTKYKSVYVHDASDTQATNYTKNPNPSRKGEAIWETSTAGTGTSSWFSDFSYFVYSTNSFFVRGGFCINGANAGLFVYGYTWGDPYGSHGFRTALVV